MQQTTDSRGFEYQHSGIDSKLCHKVIENWVHGICSCISSSGGNFNNVLFNTIAATIYISEHVIVTEILILHIC